MVRLTPLFFQFLFFFVFVLVIDVLCFLSVSKFVASVVRQQSSSCHNCLDPKSVHVLKNVVMLTESNYFLTNDYLERISGEEAR